MKLTPEQTAAMINALSNVATNVIVEILKHRASVAGVPVDQLIADTATKWSEDEQAALAAALEAHNAAS